MIRDRSVKGVAQAAPFAFPENPLRISLQAAIMKVAGQSVFTPTKQ
jgi:hypothetical protein